MRGANRVEGVALLARPMRPAGEQPDPLDDRLVGIAPLSQPRGKIVDVIGGKPRPQSVFDVILPYIDTCWHGSPPRCWRRDCEAWASIVQSGDCALIGGRHRAQRLIHAGVFSMAAASAATNGPFLGGSAPGCGLRPGLVPATASPTFFPAAAPLLAKQEARLMPSSAGAAAKGAGGRPGAPDPHKAAMVAGLEHSKRSYTMSQIGSFTRGNDGVYPAPSRPSPSTPRRASWFCRKFFAWANARRQGSSMFTPQERRTAAPDAICPSFVTGPFGSCA